MDDNLSFYIILCIIIIIVLISGYIIFIGVSGWHNDTAIIIDKYDGDVTHIVYVSNGKVTTPVISTQHEYVLVTDKGNITVNSTEYMKYTVNNKINVSINKNTGVLCLLN